MNDVKMKLLQSLIDKMDESSAGEIRGKMPKMAAVDIESNDPELADSLKDKLVGESPLDSESPLEEKSESMDDDSMRKLMEMYKEMC
jgi:hypothetical protein